MATKMTPGPWKCDHKAHPDRELAKHGNAGFRIIAEESGLVVTVAEIFPRYYESVVVNAANARAIAAVPELLEFVRRWRDEVLGGDHPDALDGWARELVMEAGEILRKVEGQ